MKQEIPTKTEAKPTFSHSTTPSRLRAASSKAKDSPKPQTSNGVSPALRARAKSVPQVDSNGLNTRRSLVLNKPKSGDDVVVGSQRGRELEDGKIVGRSGNRPVVVEQFSRPRRRADPSSRRNEEDPDEKKKELQQKLDLSQTSVRNLQSEVVALKAELDKAHSLNVELQSQNRKLSDDLAAAEAKIAALAIRDQVRINQCPFLTVSIWWTLYICIFQSVPFKPHLTFFFLFPFFRFCVTSR